MAETIINFLSLLVFIISATVLTDSAVANDEPPNLHTIDTMNTPQQDYISILLQKWI